MVPDDRLREERVDDRRRIGEPGRLHHDPAKGRDLAALAPAQEIAQLVGQVAAQRAADAAGAEKHRTLVDAAQDVVIDGDLAELVDDDGRLAHVRMAEQPRDERRLAAPEEARHEGHGRLRQG